MAKTLTKTYDDTPLQFRDDGWFNATVAAAKFGKEPFDWLRQRDTADYIAALAKHLGRTNSGFLPELNEIKELDGTSAASRTKLLRAVKKTGLVSTKQGAPETGGGTWLHPKLAVAFARWLDIDFALWADEQIDRIIHGTPEQTDWHRLRHQAASSFKVMADILTESRAEAGKETKPYHYANEAKLVNWAMTGQYAPLDREALSPEDLDLLAKLEARNATYLGMGAGRDIRKAVLLATAQRRLC